MNLIKHTIRYIKLHIFNNPRYFFTYLVRYFDPNFKLNIKYFEFNEIGRLLQEGRSIIRFGDGEIYLLNRGSLPFQKYDYGLHDLLFETVNEYTAKSPYVLGLNRLPLLKTNKGLKSHSLLNCWLPSKVYYHLYFNKQAKYLDASIFYYHDTIPKYFESYLINKKIIFVANKSYIDLIRKNKNIPFKNIEYIDTPATDAYSNYESIKSRVRKSIEGNGRENSVVLMAFGPATKAMAFELSKEGVQVIDVGQGIEVAYKDKNHIIADTLSVL